jgi:hypothetical protein
MALLDMIRENLAEPKKAKPATESSTINRYVEDAPAPYVPEGIVMDAGSVLSALESHMELRASMNPTNEPSVANQIHAALECDLPEGEAPYDPSEELENIASTLAGLDADDDVDPDQAQPDEGIEDGSSLEDLQEQPTDTH